MIVLKYKDVVSKDVWPRGVETCQYASIAKYCKGLDMQCPSQCRQNLIAVVIPLPVWVAYLYSG